MSEIALPLRPQDEVVCRRCAVHCEKVVYPSACLSSSCPFAYAYEEHGHTFMGCMQKVFEAEIDVEMLAAAGPAVGVLILQRLKEPARRPARTRGTSASLPAAHRTPD